MRNKVVLISGMQIQVKKKNKLFELFGGTILNYDRNDDKHVYKNNEVMMMTDQRPLWREYIENEKEKLLEKAE